MTIVASNSLTVSNVNDGTITHTAWAYSADGTDRFTTVYPNLNLLVNSSAKTKDGFFKSFDKVENDYGEVIMKGTNTWVARNLVDGLSIQPRDYKPGDKYTMSMDVMFTSWNLPAGTTISEFWIGQRYNGGSWNRICAIDLPKDPSKMLNQWIKITQTSTIPPYEAPSVATSSTMLVIFSGASEGSFTIRVRKPKQEQGSTATPHMSSSSEVTTADYPSYIGQYTDFTQADSTNPSDYTWSLMRGNDGKDGVDGKDGIAGKDGKGIKTTAITYQASTNGTTAPTGTWSASVPTVAKGSFLWTRTVWTYTDNTTETGYAVAYMGTNGNNGTDGIAGKDGVGIKTTTITYVGSTSGTTAPTSGWTSTVPTVAAGSYLWTKTVWTYTDNSTETGYSVARMGLKGDKGDPGIKGSDGTSGIIVSSVAPDSPQTGQLWQDTSTTPQLVKKWTGASWVIWELYAQNLKADTLETLSAKIGKLNNTYTVDYGAGVHTGTVTIENGMKIVDDAGISRTITDFTSQSSGQGMFARYLPDKSDTAKYQQAWYTPFSLRFDDTVNDWHGQITAENVTLVPWTNMPYVSGFTTAEDNPCQYRKIKNLDGSYTVQFRGQVKPTSSTFPSHTADNNFQIVSVIPQEIRPTRGHVFVPAIGDIKGTQTIRIGALTNGWIQIGVRGSTTEYVSLSTLTYII